LVTAIIPNYNHERFLQRRLESVYGQTYPHLRVILLDDASTDASRTILERYRHHPRTQAIVYNETNSGSPFLQWKKGLDLVETDWVWIAESDDWCEPDFLAGLKPAFGKMDAVLAYAQINWTDIEGNIIKKSVEKKSGWYNGPDFVREHLFGFNRLENAGMVVFNREAALQASPLWIQMRQAGDYWLWAEIARQGKVYASGRADCYFTKHAGSVSAQWLVSPTGQHEWEEAVLRMKETGCISLADIKKYITQQLSGLECIRSGIDPKNYHEQRSYWKQLAQKVGITLSPVAIMALAWKQKLVHRCRQDLRLEQNL
jgi:glycosyltransferase involved in cell wall biosynthesis